MTPFAMNAKRPTIEGPFDTVYTISSYKHYCNIKNTILTQVGKLCCIPLRRKYMYNQNVVYL